MDASLFEILEPTILDVQKMLKRSRSTLPLHNTLRDLVDVTRSRAQINSQRKNVDLESKLRSARRQNAERKARLCKLWTDFRFEIDFVDEILTQNCTLIIQQQRKEQNLIAKEKAIKKREMIAEQTKIKQKYANIYRVRELNLTAELENIRADDVLRERDERNRWKVKKEELKNTLVKYDAKMFAQEEELESIRGIINREADKLDYFQRAYASQESLYNELMREKEEYEEERRRQKLKEIRYRIATRTIVRFVEEHYPAWKKKKLKSLKKKKKYKF